MFGQQAQEGLRRYLANQPTSAELGKWPEAKRKTLSERRMWALAYFVRSLREPRSFWQYLFADQAGRYAED